MSAGNLLGTILTCIFASAFWIVIGAAVDKIGIIFNMTIRTIPSFQDAVTGFAITQYAWMILLVVIWLVAWINYAQNEAAEAGGFV